MNKGRSLVLVAAALGFAAGALACSGSGGTPSTFDGSDASPPADPAPVGLIVPGESATPTTPPSTAATCDPAIPDPFKATWLAPAKVGKCGSADIKGYYDACLADPSKKDVCLAWTSTHADCTACLERKDKAGPVQWYDAASQPRIAYTVNVAGCIALQQNKLAESDCGGSYNAAVQCSRGSCTTCLDTGGSFAQFRTCQQAVQQQGICKSYETAMSQACQGIKTAGTTTLQCFQGSTEAFDVFVERVETIFCGQ